VKPKESYFKPGDQVTTQEANMDMIFAEEIQDKKVAQKPKAKQSEYFSGFTQA